MTPRTVHVKRSEATAWLFILPSLMLLCWVIVYPGVNTIALSMFRTRYTQVVTFIGLKNYLSLFSDRRGIGAIVHSFTYVFGSLALAMPLGLMLALMLNRPIKFKTLAKVILISPWFVSLTVAGLLWGWLYNPLYGLINYWLSVAGLPRLYFLERPGMAMLSLIITTVWRTYPFAFVMIHGALQTVPEVIYEAAKIDGATRVRTFFSLVFPLILNPLIITVINLGLMYFGMVTIIITLTGGGPLGSTETLAYYSYSEGFVHWNMGRGSAAAVITLLINVALSSTLLLRWQKGVYV
jgi:multiple sugar transport system permease protein